MIFIESFSFLFILGFVVLYTIVQRLTQNKLVLNILLFIGSVIVLTSVTDLESLAVISVVSVAVYRAGVFLKSVQTRKKLYLGIFVSVLIILFVLKNYNLADLSLLHRVGLSYILFRLIHFLVDSSKGEIKEYNLLSFLNYIIFFPSFIAGPIDEYNNFNYWISQKHNSYRVTLVKAGVFKLVLGVTKKFFIVPIIASYALDFSNFSTDLSWQLALFYSLILYSFYILLDFSGYSDIAIGTAYLMGIRTPENFDNPYLSKSLSVFWKKWHMTFSNFLFKYVFKPFVTKLSATFTSSPRLLISSIGYIFTFIICGAWHGNTMNFVYWGLWHGVGLILFKLWDIYVVKNRFKSGTNVVLVKLHQFSGILFTFLFVTVGWFFFNYSTGEINLILSNLGPTSSKYLKVEKINYQNLNGFKILFDDTTMVNENIELEYNSAGSQTYYYTDITGSENGTYYFIPENQKKSLSELKIRAVTGEIKGEWFTAVVYTQVADFEPTDLQKLFFGNSDKIEKIKTQLPYYIGTEIYLTPEYKTQELKLSASMIPNYGWAIRLDFMAFPEKKTTIQYKKDGGEWVTYTDTRDGKYNFGHIHGTFEFNGENRNLEPGVYEVRIKYHNEAQSSIWFENKITIPDYVNGK